jgi:hypothetical protein
MRAYFWTAAILALASGAAPATEPEPTVWLRALYDFYHRAEKRPDPTPPSAEDTAALHASRRFAALLKRDLACENKSHEICAIDWDFIVNGQAWELSHVQVGPLQASGDRATVTATFVNMKSTNRNVYEFVSEDGAWKLDDVVSNQSGRAPIRISKILRDFKFY